MSKHVYGIDAGTTRSSIAYQDDTGRANVIKNSEGTDTTPSVVAIYEEGQEVIVGQVAKDNAIIDPDNTISFVKTKMGIEKEVFYGPDGEYSTTPIEVTAHILKKLAQDAEMHMGEEVKDVVITVPAYFGEEQKKATRQAGEIVGFNVIAIIDEPTAAAISYGIERNPEGKTVLVYDLGGGTFDVSVMQVSKASIDVVTTDGNHNLGGKDWDGAFMSHIIERFEEESGFDGEYPDEDLQDIALKVEKAKHELTVKDKTKMSLRVDAYRASLDVTRQEFEEVTRLLLDQTIDLTKKVIEDTKELNVDAIDEILLVGGSAKMPQVMEAIKENFEIEAKLYDPDLAVARGAAIFAILKKGVDPDQAEIGGSILPPHIDPEDIPEKIIKTKSTKSFGIKVERDGELCICNIIFKNDETPCEIVKTFGTAAANQVTANIEVYESTILDEHYEVDEDLKIGEAILELPEGLLKDSPIEITLTLNDEGIIELSGKELSDNRIVKAKFQSDCIFSDEELERIIEQTTTIKVV